MHKRSNFETELRSCLTASLLLVCALCFGQLSIVNEIFNSRYNEYFFRSGNQLFTISEYSIVDTLSPRYGLTVCFIKIPIHKVSFFINNTQSFSDQIFEKNKSRNDIVITNGGFHELNLNNERVPMGLVISRHQIRSPKTSWRIGGVIFKIKDSIGLVHISRLQELGFDEALQSYPMLVEDSKNGIKSNDSKYADRTCIGITNHNELIVCGAFNDVGTSITLFEFAEFLASVKKKPRPDIKTALNLDGGPSAHIYFPNLKKHYGYSGNNYWPNLIQVQLK